METMKRNWVSPVNETQQFVPQEFIAACAQPTHWIATCRDVSCLIFEGAGPNDWTSDMNRGGCGKSHEFTLANGLKPEANCWLLKNVRTREPGTINAWDSKYSDWFERTGNESGSGWKLKANKIDSLKTIKELVPGYYNDNVLGGNSMLVTDDIANIKNPS